MHLEPLQKAIDALKTLKLRQIQSNTFYITENALITKQQQLLHKIKPYIVEIITKTITDINAERPEDRSHVIEEYKRYVDSIEMNDQCIF
ncbi:hypothetical protein COBT_003638, partial [Conglomerata obtusa]